MDSLQYQNVIKNFRYKRKKKPFECAAEFNACLGSLPSAYWRQKNILQETGFNLVECGQNYCSYAEGG